MAARLIRPDWPAPPTVVALSTTRSGGVSRAPWDSFNLGDHVGDDFDAVLRNRALLQQDLPEGAQIAWLRQVHGTAAVQAGRWPEPVEADASWTQERGVFCAVLTADCLPVLLCDRTGSVVAAAHAGWRGLVNGVLESVVAAMPVVPGSLLAWLGPAIGPNSFEVGDLVREQALAAVPQARTAAVAACFTGAARTGHWYADLYALARERLEALGVEGIYGEVRDTLAEPEAFFSYRRDGRSGRMATLIGLQESR